GPAGFRTEARRLPAAREPRRSGRAGPLRRIGDRGRGRPVRGGEGGATGGGGRAGADGARAAVVPGTVVESLTAKQVRRGWDVLDKFHVCSRTDEQGVMRLTLPVGVAETEYEVVVVIAPKGPVGKRE